MTTSGAYEDVLRELREGDLVEIRWVDACNLNGWQDRESARRDAALSLCCSLGFLLSATPALVRIVQSITVNPSSTDADDDEVSNVLAIPGSCVESIRLLTSKVEYRR